MHNSSGLSALEMAGRLRSAGVAAAIGNIAGAAPENARS